MILVDYRSGSVELIPLLQMLKLDVEKATLPYGDFSFMGNGPGGLPIPVGIERKALRDWIDSFYSGRYPGHQLPGLLDPAQGYKVMYVILEGVWRMNQETGFIQVPGGGKKHWVDLNIGTQSTPKNMMWRELESMLVTFEMKGGTMFRKTNNKAETSKFLATLYHWWVGKDWDEHKSHLRFHTETADPQILVKPSLCRQVAATLPGVGWTKSANVAGHFKTVYAMVQASEKDWTQIDGIGKSMAKKLWHHLRGSNSG